MAQVMAQRLSHQDPRMFWSLVALGWAGGAVTLYWAAWFVDQLVGLPRPRFMRPSI